MKTSDRPTYSFNLTKGQYGVTIQHYRGHEELIDGRLREVGRYTEVVIECPFNVNFGCNHDWTNKIMERSYCHPNDNFCRKTGIKKALKKLFKNKALGLNRRDREIIYQKCLNLNHQKIKATIKDGVVYIKNKRVGVLNKDQDNKGIMYEFKDNGIKETVMIFNQEIAW